jgi:hypothetical protein
MAEGAIPSALRSVSLDLWQLGHLAVMADVDAAIPRRGARAAPGWRCRFWVVLGASAGSRRRTATGDAGVCKSLAAIPQRPLPRLR